MSRKGRSKKAQRPKGLGVAVEFGLPSDHPNAGEKIIMDAKGEPAVVVTYEAPLPPALPSTPPKLPPGTIPLPLAMLLSD